MNRDEIYAIAEETRLSRPEILELARSVKDVDDLPERGSGAMRRAARVPCEAPSQMIVHVDVGVPRA